jgi:hypothetical protein
MQHPGKCAEVQRDQDAEKEEEKDFGDPAGEPDPQCGKYRRGERGPELEARARDRGVFDDQGLLP